MTYKDRLLKHLADYKETVLGIKEPGVFGFRGQDIPKDHILPAHPPWLNILPSVRDKVRRFVSESPHIRLHRYFHHLNSSQAFALNRFVPFFDGRAEGSTSLLRALGQEGMLNGWDLEVIPVPEEETNVDVTWTTSLGMRTICEVKLSESEFSPARQDKEHLDKLRDTYAPLLQHHLPALCLEPAAFCANYQIFRNVWHMLRLDQGVLVFLLPRANDRLWSSLSSTLSKLSPRVRERVAVKAIEDVLTALCRRGLPVAVA